MRRGDIYLVSLNSAPGQEKQPVLIVSPDAFNLVMGTPLVVPISNEGDFARSRGFTVSLERAGTTTTGLVLCNQLRPLDLKARQGQRLESVSQVVMEDVLAKLTTLVS